jgi:hypothetical protein
MESKVREERIRIFRQDLYTLEKEGYLPENIVEMVAKAHHQYYVDVINQERNQPTTVLEQEQPKQKAKQTNKKPQKVKKTMTPEEIRERNITWSLNIGVIFLLIGGLFVATSNWQSMTAFTKSGLIALVGLLFYGLAYLTKRVLHIDQTSFAFIVLGSLFVPIFILSLGWYGLLGPYLSIDGNGRYFLGVIGSIVPTVVYIQFAKNLRSRLFVWFTYVSFTAGAAFFLAGLELKLDIFYLGLMLLNVVYIWLYHIGKKRDLYVLFTKELTAFIQVNLVLSTLFMLFLYDSQLVHSFNLFLTAAIYLSMIYVSGRKEYHFVFSLMVVYAVYQLFEHPGLKTFSAVGYALIGIGVIFVPRLLKGECSLEKTFQYTSAIISGFAFIYISFEGILLRAGNPSVVLLIAYLLVAANFIYLSNLVKNTLFSYLSSLFLASALYEAVTLIFNSIKVIHFPSSLSLTGFLLYFFFGILFKKKSLQRIQISARDFGLALMGIGLLAGLGFSYWLELGGMLLLLLLTAYLAYKKEHRTIMKETAKWVFPSSLGLSLISFGEEINSHYPNFHSQLGEGVNFAIGALVVFLSYIGWRKTKEIKLSRTSLFVSQILYTVAILLAIVGPINKVWIQPVLLLVGIGMYSLFYQALRTKWAPFLISFAALVSYFSLTQSFSMQIELNQTVSSLIVSTSAMIMLMIAYFYLKKDTYIANAFSWVGNVIYPITLAYTYLAYHSEASISFILAVFAYAISTKLSVVEWKIKVFLYGSFTALFFAISNSIDILNVKDLGWYVFPITSTLIMLFFIIATPPFKKRTTYYLVPFSFIGILTILVTYPFNVVPFLITIVYSMGLLIFLHVIKRDILAVVPLFFTFLATVEFSFFTALSEMGKLLLTAGIGSVSVLVGHFMYERLGSGSSIKNFKVDMYTATSFLYFLFMYYYDNTQVWTNMLPGILISVTILLQAKRVPKRYSVWMIILGAIYTLQPYYSMISELQVPALWDREVTVLPWIAVVIFVRIKLKGKYAAITKPLEWGILLIVSFALIQDGISSSTIYDAIILGSLSLISMLAGMMLQTKSYFFVGSGILLLNVFLQTRPYWGNMPWWGYLLIVGFILITVASFNEWNKQKTSKGETTFIMNLRNKMFNKLKHWD